MNLESINLKQVLLLAAHPDDVEIGCAGTLLLLAKHQPECKFHYICLTGDDREQEAIDSANALLGDKVSIQVGQWKDTLLPYDDPVGLKQWLVSASRNLKPDIVFTPALFDRHQDHRFLSELAWQLFRSSTILEFDIPKWEGDRQEANLFVPLSDDIVEAKIQHLETHFKSQQGKPWYTRDMFAASMRMRGVETGAAGSNYAEAFAARKLQWDIAGS